MLIKKLLPAFALALVFITAACKKDNYSTTATSTNIPLQTTIQTGIPLGVADNFAVLAGSGITNTGATVINGDLGLSPGTSVGGFPPGILNGTLHINDAAANQSKLDIATAYDNAKNRTATDIVTLSGNVGGLTLTPGLYKSTSSLALSSGNVTFDALGNPNAVFIIQIASAFTATSGGQVVLAGGAKASNIYWQVGSSATFGTTSVFKGTVIALQSISFNTGATLDGRAFSRNGAVTMSGNTITKE